MTLLSICIPTLNRVDFLRFSLQGLLPAAQSAGVEVCVSDNASADGTQDLLNELSAQYPCLRIRRSEVKLDIDASMLAAIAMGSGEYIYPLGDDDCLESGGLPLLLSYLSRGDDAVVLNGWHTGPQLQKKSKHLDDLAGKVYHRPDAAFAALWDRMPFGSFLARRALFGQSGPGIYKGTSHAYTGVVWDQLAEQFVNTGRCQVSCMPDAVVLIRGAEKTWKAQAADILLFQIGDWFWKVAGQPIYREAVLSAMDAYARIYLKSSKLMRYKVVGQLDWPRARRLMIMWPRRKSVIWGTMLTPAPLQRAYLRRRGISLVD